MCNVLQNYDPGVVLNVEYWYRYSVQRWRWIYLTLLFLVRRQMAKKGLEVKVEYVQLFLAVYWSLGWFTVYQLRKAVKIWWKSSFLQANISWFTVYHFITFLTLAACYHARLLPFDPRLPDYLYNTFPISLLSAMQDAALSCFDHVQASRSVEFLFSWEGFQLSSFARAKLKVASGRHSQQGPYSICWFRPKFRPQT